MGYLDYPGLQRYHGKVQEEIDELKDDLSVIDDAIYTETELSDKLVTNGFRLTLDGLAVVDSSYTLLRYPVTAGTAVKVLSDDRFQFQSQLGVSSLPPSPRVGGTHEAYNGITTVPTGATYIALSTPASNGSAYAASVVSLLDNVVRFDTEQELTDEQKTQARENIGAMGEQYRDVYLYNASAPLDTLMFTSEDAPVGTHLYYDFLMPVTSEGYGASGGMGLYDSSNNRLAFYGRVATSQHADTVYQGEFDVPEGFDHATWGGVSGTPTSSATMAKVKKRVGSGFDGYVRYDETQDLTGEQKVQAKENIGLSDCIFVGEATENQVLFDSNDISSGQLIFVDLEANGSGVGILEFCDENDARLAYYGKPSASISQTKYRGVLTIPDGFDYCKWSCTNAITGTVRVDKLIDASLLTGNYADIYGIHANMLDYAGFIDNNVLRVIDDTYVNINGYCVTTYIPVIPNSILRTSSEYISNVYGTVFYDANQKQVNGELARYQEIPVPDNACYARFTLSMAEKATASIVTCLTPYMPVPSLVNPYKRYDVHRYGTLLRYQSSGMIYNGSPAGSSSFIGPDLFDLDDVSVGDIVTYYITLPANPEFNKLGCIELLDANNSRLALYGRTSGGDTGTIYNGSFVIPDNFNRARWFCNITTSSSVHVSISKEGEYQKFSHIAFPFIDAFDGKFVLTYKCGLRHGKSEDTSIVDPTWGNFMLDTISPEGKHEHVKLFNLHDDFGLPSDADGSLNLSTTKDGNYLIMVGGGNYAFSGDTIARVDMVIVCLDKSLNVIDYKVISQFNKWPQSPILVTPDGHLITAGWDTTNLETIGLIRSNEVFSGSVSNLTFSWIPFATYSEIGRKMSEVGLGYFNDKLVAVCRTDSDNRKAFVKYTENLEGADGWSSAITLDMEIDDPLLPHYRKGNFLPVFGTRRYSDHREPYMIYLNSTDLSIAFSGCVDDNMITQWNGYMSGVGLGDETYAVAYYQEAVVDPSARNFNNGFTGLYYKWINARLIIPQLNFVDLE